MVINQNSHITMKRFHVHVRVKDLNESIAFYNALFGTTPTIVKDDYAKWMLDDPFVNFAISDGHEAHGIEHLGIQAESPEELNRVFSNMQMAKGAVRSEGHCACCYSKSQKSWITDPQGVDWEAFHTYGTTTYYGDGVNAKASTDTVNSWTSN